MAALLPEPNKHLIKHGVEAPVPALKFAGVEVAEATVVVPKTGLVITDQAAVARHAVRLIRNLRNCEQRSIHREIHAMLTVVADGRIAVVNATHDVGPCGRSYLDERSPGIIGMGGHTGGVEENADRIAVEAVLYEHVVVGRNEKIVAGSDSTESELDAIIKELLLVGHVDEVERFAAKDLLNRKNIVNVVRR